MIYSCIFRKPNIISVEARGFYLKRLLVSLLHGEAAIFCEELRGKNRGTQLNPGEGVSE